MFKIHRTNVIAAMAEADITFKQLAARAELSLDDLCSTHLSSGKAARLAVALGLPFTKTVFGATRKSRVAV